jgi:hypothetical protein
MSVKQIVVDARLVIDPPSHIQRYTFQRKGETWGEAYARELQDWVNEFHAFLRDYRSQDANILRVEKVTGCSGCGQVWETQLDENGILQCSGCGNEVDVGNKTMKEAK